METLIELLKDRLQARKNQVRFHSYHLEKEKKAVNHLENQIEKLTNQKKNT